MLDSVLESNIEVSVIVCHHRGDFIYSFVESILRSVVDFKYEIIVVTSDELVYSDKLKGCKILYSSQLPAYKRNIGALHANGKYIAFFDDDVEVGEFCLQRLRNALRDYHGKGVRMVYGKLYKADTQNRLDEAGSYLTWTGFLWSRAEQNIEDNGMFESEVYVLAGKSASCMVEKEAFYEVEGFDQDFGILGEETDLSWRLWLKGYKVLFIPLSKGIHYFNTRFKPPTTFYTNKRVFYNGCRNYITMLLKNLGPLRCATIVPLHVSIWFAAGVAKIITGRFSEGWNILCGLWYVVSHFGYIIRKRKRVQSARRVKDKELIPLIMQSPKPKYYIERFCRYIRGSVHG